MPLPHRFVPMVSDLRLQGMFRPSRHLATNVTVGSEDVAIGSHQHGRRTSKVWLACGGSRPRQVPDFAHLWRCGGWFATELVAPLHHQIEDASAAGTTPGNEIRERIFPSAIQGGMGLLLRTKRAKAGAAVSSKGMR